MLSLACPPGSAPTLVVAIGNPSRGDDALGPEIGHWLEAQALPGVEVLVDFQCQVEHALDLAGRRRVVFVDASVTAAAPFELRRVEARPGASPMTHALEPEAVLHCFRSLAAAPPPEAWTLAIPGESFALGEGLSDGARANLEAAKAALRGLIIAG